MMGDDDLGAVLEILAQQEQADLDQAHGEDILASVSGAEERREAEDRALLDAIVRTRLATEPKGAQE